jgi:hypothetical protein
MDMHVFVLSRFEFFFCDLANEGSVASATRLHTSTQPRRAHGATCLMNIATPPGLAQVCAKDPEWKIVRRGTPTCVASSPSRADTDTMHIIPFTITRVDN